MVLIDMGSHVHIHSRDCRLHARVRVVHRDSVDDTFLDCICITHDKAFKPQFVLKDITQQVLVHRAGHAVIIIKCCHSRRSAFLHGGPERRQIDIVQLGRRHRRRVIVSSALAGAVADIVLGAGRHIIFR